MSEEMKVPGFGTMNKKYVLALGVVAFATVGYMLFKKHSEAAAAAQGGTYPAAASAADQTANQDTTGSGVSGDGGGYGSNPYGDWYGSAGDQSVPNGKIIGYDWMGRPIYGSSASSASSSTQTESQWIAAAASDLESSTGVTYTTAAAALTKWIAGLQLTAAEVVIVQEAIHVEGAPPNGIMPIHQLPSGDGGGGSGGGSSGGGHGPSAPPAPTVSAIDAHGATVQWGAAAAGDHPIGHYVIWTRGAGKGPTQAGTSHGTSFRIGGFKPNTWHAVWVNAVDTAGRTSAASPSTAFTTHRR